MPRMQPQGKALKKLDSAALVIKAHGRKKAVHKTYLESGAFFVLRSPRSRYLFAPPYSRKLAPCRPALCLPRRDGAIAVIGGGVLVAAASAGTSARSAGVLSGGTKGRPRMQPMGLVQYQVWGDGDERSNGSAISLSSRLGTSTSVPYTPVSRR